MFQLLIKKADGSLYWKEHFNLLSDLNTWLTEERKRKYWKEEFTTEVIDLTPTPPTAEELAAEAARKTQIQALKIRIKELDALSDLTAAETKEALRKFIKLRILMKDFD